MINIDSLRQTLDALRNSIDHPSFSLSILDIAKKIPHKKEYIELFGQCLDLMNKIDDPSVRRNILFYFIKDIPKSESFKQLYKSAMESMIIAADGLSEGQHRTNDLLRIAHELPKTEEYLSLRVHAWRLALNLPDKPRYMKASLESIARHLPKTSDYSFYRRYTLLGVAGELPKEGVFIELYKEAVMLAINATSLIEEPYYRKYVLLIIANELRNIGEFPDIYRRSVTEAYKAAIAIMDPFAREHALIEVIRELPKSMEYSELLMGAIEEALNFFTVKKWMEDVDAIDVVDFILSAEEPGIKESKKRRFSREKFSNILSAEIDKVVPQMKDIRLIEVLKPYTHIWIQPKKLRDTVRAAVTHLESLKNKYHGREIERPVLIRESHTGGTRNMPAFRRDMKSVGVPVVNDCIAIDLGATNTVIVKKKGNEQPELIVLPSISRKYDSISIVPTILSSETNSIGVEVSEEKPIVNIKQMLLERNPKGKAHMDRFFRTLYQHLKKATMTGGWFSITNRTVDVMYITVPVGFQFYKNTMKEIVERTARGVSVEFIEEPLAAAIGYQVVENRDKVIMIIDFGGSTLNTMIARVNTDGVHVIAKPDKAQIMGGHDIDHWLGDYLATKVGLPVEEVTQYSLLHLAEDIKINLSKKKEVQFEFDGSHSGNVTREELEDVLEQHEFYKIVDRNISNVLKKAEKVGLKKDRLEAILITGGSSQIPSFREKIEQIFPELRRQNMIYDHSPLSAVAFGAAIYGTKEVTDRHLSMAYAIRYATNDEDAPYSYSIILEKGEPLPLEKSFRIKPALKLGIQNQISIELFEVPESMIVRRWVAESGIEFIKQELQQTGDITLTGLKTATLPIEEEVKNDIDIQFNIKETGHMFIRYGGRNTDIDTELRLQ